MIERSVAQVAQKWASACIHANLWIDLAPPEVPELACSWCGMSHIKAPDPKDCWDEVRVWAGTNPGHAAYHLTDFILRMRPGSHVVQDAYLCRDHCLELYKRRYVISVLQGAS